MKVCFKNVESLHQYWPKKRIKTNENLSHTLGLVGIVCPVSLFVHTSTYTHIVSFMNVTEVSVHFCSLECESNFEFRMSRSEQDKEKKNPNLFI